MKRLLDANLAFSGSEPKFSKQLSETELIQTLNWYSQNKDNKTAYKYASDFLKKKHKIDASEVVKNYSTTFGWVCRILTNGGSLLPKNQKNFDSFIYNVVKQVKSEKKNNVKVEKTTFSIQDKLNERINLICGELEGSVDEYILSKFKVVPSPYAIMLDMSTKAMHAKKIIELFKQIRDQFQDTLTTDDEQILEAYSCYSKSEIKKIIAYCDLIVNDAIKISGESKQNRKPRKRKQKTPEQLVAKLKYSKKFADLKLTSIDPTEIIGKSQLWIYNTKTRKLGCYNADDASGLSVKGSTILNFTESKSTHKKLRKPEQILPEVISGGKVFLRNVLGDIRAVESKLTGRINKDTILLRVIK